MITVETKDAFYSNADGKGKEKLKNIFKKKTSSAKVTSDKKTTRQANRVKRKNERIKRRLAKANAKLKPGATPLTAKDLPNGKQKFVGFFKKLFKKKGTPKDAPIYLDKKADGTVVELKPNEVQVIPSKIPNVEPLAVAKKAIDEAKANNANIVTDANGNVSAEYGEDDVIAVDLDNGDSNYYAPTDVENVEDAKDIDGKPTEDTLFTTKNILIGLGAIALIGGLIYFGSKGSHSAGK